MRPGCQLDPDPNRMVCQRHGGRKIFWLDVVALTGKGYRQRVDEEGAAGDIDKAVGVVLADSDRHGGWTVLQYPLHRPLHSGGLLVIIRCRCDIVVDDRRCRWLWYGCFCHA